MHDDDDIHQRFREDSLPLGRTRYSVVRLFDDSRWPWLLLIPRMGDSGEAVRELHQLPSPRRHGFLEDVNRSSAILAGETGCDSVNIGMLGNVVSDLHCHVLARFESDPAWPAPVWGFGSRVSYTAEGYPKALVDAVKSGLALRD